MKESSGYRAHRADVGRQYTAGFYFRVTCHKLPQECSTEFCLPAGVETDFHLSYEDMSLDLVTTEYWLVDFCLVILDLIPIQWNA